MRFPHASHSFSHSPRARRGADLSGAIGFALALTALAALCAPATAQKKTAPAAPPPALVETIGKVGLNLSFPASFEGVARRSSEPLEDDELGQWNARFGEKRVFIDLEAWDNFARAEPSRITARVHDYVRSEEYDGPNFQFVEHRLVPGRFGYAPYGSLLWGSMVERGTTMDIASVWYFAGVTDKSAYLLMVQVEPVASAAEQAQVLEFLTKGVSYSGSERDAKWTREETQQRWDEDSALSDKARKDFKLIRTAHYLVMTNSSGGDKFAKQMELNYAQIQKTYPFPEVPGRRLMPVFLFQDPGEYHAFCVKQFNWSLEEARKSKGVASGDFYATWYEAPQDPVHIHEATHQIFRNRLELRGAGSWYQEGVAEYIETKPNERGEIARRVKNGEHTPLREFMRLESLLMSSEDDKSGDSAAGLHYKQAALLIELLRESKPYKDKFLDWLHAMGHTPDNDLEAIERVFQRVYGLSIEQLDQELVKYCQKR